MPHIEALRAELERVLAEALDGTRIFKYSGGMDSVRLTLVGETKARSHCFDVTYGVDGPADVRTYSCPNGPRAYP